MLSLAEARQSVLYSKVPTDLPLAHPQEKEVHPLPILQQNLSVVLALLPFYSLLTSLCSNSIMRILLLGDTIEFIDSIFSGSVSFKSRRI